MAEPPGRPRDAALAELLTDLRILVVDTGRVWWRLLPQLLALYLIGWLGSQAALRLAVWAGDLSAWLALALFALNFVALLAALVLILRLLGRELGIRDLLPAEESVADGRDESVSRLLAVTLLPFLGLYAAFGQVTEAASTLATEQTTRYGVLGSAGTVLGVLNDAATQHPWRLVLVVVGVYAVRRGLDLLHERTGRQLLGLLVAFVESFFLLLVILGGIRLVQQARLWLEDRVLWSWGSTVRDAVAAVLARLPLDVPAVLARAAGFLGDEVWPVLAEVVSQPVVWLAVAALVYGSQVLSLAEVWRKSQGVARGWPVPAALTRVRLVRLPGGLGPAPRGLRRVAGEARAAFLGDVDDKYLPTVHSLRLILRAGLVFLGSFVLAHGVISALTGYAGSLLLRLLGGHTVDFWLVWGPWVDLAQVLPFEPLRLCLLAVAFRRCLELFQQRSAEPTPSVTPAAVVPLVDRVPTGVPA